MILIAGAGATAEAARAIRKMQRDLDRRFRRTRDRIGSHAVRYDYEPERTEFPCVFLCGTCGYFVDEPHEDEESTISCPACGDRDWIDLSVEPLANRIRDIEEDARMQIPLRVHVAVVAAALAVFALMIAGLLLGSYASTGQFLAEPYAFYAKATGFLALFVVPLAYFFLRRPAAVLLLRGRERVPHRWHVPTALPDPEATPDRSHENLEVEPTDELLTAPASGEECVAYQICVLFDVAGDARPPEWVLQEQRAIGARLGEKLEIEAGQLYLESPLERVDVPDLGDTSDPSLDDSEETGELYDKLKRFLRERGLFITEGEFHFYEARLSPGDAVDVSVHDGTCVLRHVSAEDPEGLPLLPHPSSGVARGKEEAARDSGEDLAEQASTGDVPRARSRGMRIGMSVLLAAASIAGLFWLFGSFLTSPYADNWLFTMILVWVVGPACICGVGTAIYQLYRLQSHGDYYDSIDN